MIKSIKEYFGPLQDEQNGKSRASWQISDFQGVIMVTSGHVPVHISPQEERTEKSDMH
jgi:hypothetical protein